MRAVPPIGVRHLVAAEVRAQMARQQVTQVQLSRAIGMAQQSLSERLRGKTPFTTDDLGRVADALGVHPAELLGGVAPPTGNPPEPIRATTDRYSRNVVTLREVFTIKRLPTQIVQVAA